MANFSFEKSLLRGISGATRKSIISDNVRKEFYNERPDLDIDDAELIHEVTEPA